MPQITSKKDFLDTFKKGSVFFWIDAAKDGIPTVVRQSNVRSVHMNQGKYLNVLHRYDDMGKTRLVETAVGDLLSGIRGIFTTREEAEAVVTQRRRDFAADPTLAPALIQGAYNDALGLRANLACAAV